MATGIDLIRRGQGQTPAADTDGELQDFLDACADMGSDRVAAFDLHREFYEGEQAVELTDRLREFLEASTGVRFRENFCEPMVDMVAERLTVEGFAVTIGDEEDEFEQSAALVRWLARFFWRANRLDATSGVVHTVALSRGEAFGIVGWDDDRGRPTFSYNGPERVRIEYADDDPEAPLYAVKTWDTDEAGPSNENARSVVRMNVYYPDRIECWFKLHSSSGRGGWQRWMDEGTEDEPAVWPRPWVDAQGEPLGIPVIAFLNRPLGDGKGRSELVNVVPMQMEHNKQVLDLAMVLDNQGWSQRWVSGVDPTTASFTNAPGEVWVAQAKEAAFGQFNNADIAPILESIEKLLSRMARRSGMPLHLLTTGDMPSGESIKASESRLVKRCRDRATTYGNAWEDAALMAIRLAKHAGVDVPAPDDLSTLTIDTLWEDPASEDEAAEANTAAVLNTIGVSKRTLLTRLGFDPDQEEANRRTEADEAVAAAQRFLDTGDDGDGASGSGNEDDDPPPPDR